MQDVTTMPIQEARDQSKTCPYCHGDGFATIFHPEYDGQPYVEVIDTQGVPRRRLRRTVAYCVCAAGRVTMFNHQKSRDASDVYKRTPDLEPMISGGSIWTVDDPTMTAHDPTISWSKIRAEINQRRAFKPNTGPSRRPIVSPENPVKPQAVQPAAKGDAWEDDGPDF